MNFFEIIKDAFKNKDVKVEKVLPPKVELNGKIYKYLVLSDTHQLVKELGDLKLMYPDFDDYLHCGDSELETNQMIGWKCVKGNHDLANFPNELIVDVGNKKALIVHSHLQYSFYTKENLAKLAHKYNVDLVFYGHNHVFNDEIVDGVRLMNPGSLRHSRDNASHSYAIFEIDEHDNISFTRCYLDEVEDNYNYQF